MAYNLKNLTNAQLEYLKENLTPEQKNFICGDRKSFRSAVKQGLSQMNEAVDQDSKFSREVAALFTNQAVRDLLQTAYDNSDDNAKASLLDATEEQFLDKYASDPGAGKGRGAGSDGDDDGSEDDGSDDDFDMGDDSGSDGGSTPGGDMGGGDSSNADSGNPFEQGGNPFA